MASLYSHGYAAAAIALGIVVTFASVMGQSDETNCTGKCSQPPVGKFVSFVITETISNVTNSSICFPYNTTLLYVCKEQKTYQFAPKLNQDKILITCTGKGWLDRSDKGADSSPNCVKRENHCHSLPARNPNIIFQINGQDISIDDNDMASLNYTVETIVTYRCKNPKQNYSQQWRCTKKNESYSWELTNGKVCEESPSRVLTEKPNNLFTAETAEAHDFDSETQTNHSARSLPPVNLPRDLLIGICSLLGFVLIAVLFGILYKNRARLGKRYNDTANHTRQPFTSMPQGDESKEKFADGKENLLYANIIPIKVNQETIYAEVEIGKIGKSRPTTKLTIDDDQLHTTTYAEIRHSIIPQRR